MAQAPVRPRRASLIPFWILDAPSGKNAKSQRLLHARPMGSAQDQEPPQLLTIFSSFPRVAIHRIGSLYVRPGGGDKPGRVVCVTWGAGLTWCPRVGAGRIQDLSVSIRGMGPGRQQDSMSVGRRVWEGGSALAWGWPGGFGVAHTHTHSWVFLGKDLNKTIPIVLKRAASKCVSVLLRPVALFPDMLFSLYRPTLILMGKLTKESWPMVGTNISCALSQSPSQHDHEKETCMHGDGHWPCLIQ